MATPGRLLRRQDDTRRRSRPALAVIPNSTSIIISPGEAVTVEVTTMDNVLNSRYGIDSRRKSVASPDELVIQKRGRRRRTIVWSPDIDACKRDSLLSLSSLDRTPVKSPKKAELILRSTPRKRLMLDGDSGHVTPEKRRLTIFEAARSSDNSLNDETNLSKLATGLRGLSQEQLVKMIVDLVAMHDQGSMLANDKLSDLLLKNMPAPDMQPLRERLAALKQNVFASLLSNHDSNGATDRSIIHLQNFQKALVEQGSNLVASEHWFTVIQYVLWAWSMTKELPDGRSQDPDNPTRKCFQTLTQFCTTALKNGTFSLTVLDHFEKRINAMVEDHEDLHSCLKIIADLKRCHT